MADNDSGEFDEFEDTEEQDIDEESEESFEEDLESIELEEPVVAQSGGVRGLTIVLLIVFLAVTAYSIYWHLDRQAKIRAAQEAKMQRIQTYKTQLTTVREDVMAAKAAFAENDVEKGVEALKRAKEKLTVIGSQANESNDQQWANYIMKKKEHVLSADEVIGEKAEEYEQAKSTMEQARDDMKDAIDRLSGKFENVDLSGTGGGGAPPAEPSEEPEETAAPTEEPAAEIKEPAAPTEEPAVEPEEPAADVKEPAPAPEEPTAPEEETAAPPEEPAGVE